MEKDARIYIAGQRGLGWKPRVSLEEGIKKKQNFLNLNARKITYESTSLFRGRSSPNSFQSERRIENILKNMRK